MSRDIPIIMSAPMVRATWDGYKTMTRRLAWRESRGLVPKRVPSPWQKVQPGDRLWVRENALYWIDNFGPNKNKPSKVAAYAADGYELEDGERWTPSIHMPRWASRLTLIVTATKIEPLQAISEDDVLSEGISRKIVGVDVGAGRAESRYMYSHDWDFGACDTAKHAFSILWTGLHGADSWRDNPEVVAINFRVVKANIDAPEAKAA